MTVHKKKKKKAQDDFLFAKEEALQIQAVGQ